MEESSATAIVKPWYRQFYLRRGDAEWCSDQVSDDGYAAGLEAIGGFVYVGTTTYGSPTEVVVRTWPRDPGADESADRYLDAELRGSGDLAVLNWEAGEPPVAELGLPTGDVLLRASWHGTAAAAAHPDSDVGGEALSPERVILDIWPAP